MPNIHEIGKPIIESGEPSEPLSALLDVDSTNKPGVCTGCIDTSFDPYAPNEPIGSLARTEQLVNSSQICTLGSIAAAAA